jgi:uroporphyrinogen-III decarboxylase
MTMNPATALMTSLNTTNHATLLKAKGAHYALEVLAKTEYDVIQIDWTMDPAEARRRVGPHKTLQGNMDPCALYVVVTYC